MLSMKPRQFMDSSSGRLVVVPTLEKTVAKKCITAFSNKGMKPKQVP